MSATLFTNVAIFDGTGSKPFAGEVKVEGNRIKAVARGHNQIDRSDGATVVDGQGMTLMPGLVEAHAHMTFPSSFDRIVPTQLPPPEQHQFITAHNAKVLLDHGFTSAFSGGATRPGIEVALRDEVAAGWLPGPRIKAASFERNASGVRGAFAPGLEEARKFAQDMIDLGVDSMKLLIDGHGATNPAEWHYINYTDEELSVISQMAHDAGVFMLGHAYMPEGVKQMVRHGFRALYHCDFADEEAINMIESKKNEVFVAPCVGVLLADAYDRYPNDRELSEATGAFKALEGQRRVIPELRKRGVRVLPGGDYGFPHNPHGRNARDLELFISEFGYEPTEVLSAATKWGGELMAMGDELGQIREGFLADLLVIDGDPVANIRLLQHPAKIVVIMKDGEFHKCQIGAQAEPLRVAAE